MTTLDKAIELFGFEDPITITIATLAEQGKHELAEQLFEECKELAHPHWAQDDDDEDFEGEPNEVVLNPFSSCYFWNC